MLEATWVSVAGDPTDWCGITDDGELKCFADEWGQETCYAPSVAFVGPLSAVTVPEQQLSGAFRGSNARAIHTGERAIIWGERCDGAGRYVEEMSVLDGAPDGSIGEWWLTRGGDGWEAPAGSCLFGPKSGLAVFPSGPEAPQHAALDATVVATDYGICTVEAGAVRCAGIVPGASWTAAYPEGEGSVARFEVVPETWSVTGEFRAAAVGLFSVCVVDQAGRASCDVDPEGGRAALGALPSSYTPPDDKLVDLVPGVVHWCGLTEGGDVVCWGDLAEAGVRSSRSVGPFESIGPYCGLKTDGRLDCWSEHPVAVTPCVRTCDELGCDD